MVHYRGAINTKNDFVFQTIKSIRKDHRIKKRLGNKTLIEFWETYSKLGNYLITKYKKMIPRKIENLTKGSIVNLMKHIFLLQRSIYNYDGSETTNRFNLLVGSKQFGYLQKNLKNFTARDYATFLKIIFRQSRAGMDLEKRGETGKQRVNV